LAPERSYSCSLTVSNLFNRECESLLLFFTFEEELLLPFLAKLILTKA
jgi:hypothetical protein